MRYLAIVFALTVVGCGNVPPPTQAGTPAPDDSGGDQSADAQGGDDSNIPLPWQQNQQQQAQDQNATPSGPAHVTVTLKVGDDTAHGTIKVLNDAGAQVAQGDSGSTFDFPSGTYTFQATVHDPHKVIGQPSHTTDPITIHPGDSTQEIHVPVAQVRLRVRRNGHPVGHARVELKKEGESDTVADFHTGEQHITIAPGRYTAVVHTGRDQITVNGLIFMEGAVQDIPVNIH